MRLVLLLLLVHLSGWSQPEQNLTIFLDSLERPTKEENAAYIRVIVNFYGKTLHCNVYDYYLSGKRKTVGTYTNKYLRNKTGPFTSYYENGKMQSQLQYREDLPHGKAYFWYESGSKKAECEFIVSNDEPIIKINQFWSRIGIQRVVDGKGRFTDEDVTSFSEGDLDQGVKSGEWWGTDYKDGFTFVEIYKKGELVSGISTDSLKQTHKYDKIFVSAQPKKGIAHFNRFFKTAMRDNASLKKEKAYVTVGVSFTVRADGNIADIEILDYKDTQADETIREILTSYGPWNPAQSRGINTETYLSVPILINRY
ncbi:hypothetical protein [Flavobacterium caeni]|uniref:MORN repeat variant n=1 Tax=Flavobacterium caeni TaxID=490189 RepID=A0A1G5GLT8_9FLAO|nr:hypothetical protein [Flavobacterium caeni]SCY52361.1 MORN repeat variant [Flavobacterium caeni]